MNLQVYICLVFGNSGTVSLVHILMRCWLLMHNFILFAELLWGRSASPESSRGLNHPCWLGWSVHGWIYTMWLCVCMYIYIHIYIGVSICKLYMTCPFFFSGQTHNLGLRHIKSPFFFTMKYNMPNISQYIPIWSFGSVSKPCTPGEHQNSW